MAYIKQTWTTGDTITADKLNHMEDGIANGSGGIVFVNMEYDDDLGGYNGNFSYNDIHTMIENGSIPVGISSELSEIEIFIFDGISEMDNTYYSYFSVKREPYLFSAEDPDENMTTGGGGPA